MADSDHTAPDHSGNRTWVYLIAMSIPVVLIILSLLMLRHFRNREHYIKAHGMPRRVGHSSLKDLLKPLPKDRA